TLRLMFEVSQLEGIAGYFRAPHAFLQRSSYANDRKAFRLQALIFRRQSQISNDHVSAAIIYFRVPPDVRIQFAESGVNPNGIGAEQVERADALSKRLIRAPRLRNGRNLRE